MADAQVSIGGEHVYSLVLMRDRLRKPIKNNRSFKMLKPVVCLVLNAHPIISYLTRWKGGKKVATKEKRWFKDVGLGFKTPSEAINGTYIGTVLFCQLLVSYSIPLDKKCPFTGDVSIRGRILTGKVVSTKMNRTIIIRRDYLHYIPKYSARIPPWTLILLTLFADRYEKRHKNLAVHVSPCFRVELGDVVTVGTFD